VTTLERSQTSVRSDLGVTRTRVEKILAVLILLESARALYFWYPAFGLIADGRLTNLGRLVWPALAAGSFYAIMRRPWLVRRGLDPLVTATIALIGVSFIWSVDMGKTLYQTLVLATVVVCGSFLSIAYDRRELVVLISNTLSVVCLVNLGAIIAGVDNGTSQTTGFFEHKNILGITAAIAVLLVGARLASNDRGRFVRVSFVITTIALFLSGSRTSQLGAMVAIVFILLMVVRRRSQAAAIALAAPLFGVFAVAFQAIGGTSAILVASGKSSDLTGRTEIWDKVTSLIGERPAAGWGFLAYWRDSGFADGSRSGFEEFGLRSAHSGYLEAALGAGVAAGVLVAVTLLALAIRGFRRSTVAQPHSADIALFAIAVMTAIVNVSETLFPATSRTLPTLMIVALSAGPMMRER
jgi:O-antigen ligase